MLLRACVERTSSAIRCAYLWRCVGSTHTLSSSSMRARRSFMRSIWKTTSTETPFCSSSSYTPCEAARQPSSKARNTFSRRPKTSRGVSGGLSQSSAADVARAKNGVSCTRPGRRERMSWLRPVARTWLTSTWILLVSACTRRGEGGSGTAGSWRDTPSPRRSSTRMRARVASSSDSIHCASPARRKISENSANMSPRFGGGGRIRAWRRSQNSPQKPGCEATPVSQSREVGSLSASSERSVAAAGPAIPGLFSSTCSR
ncbi:hypothetical protein D3C72_1241180 [compost metagenome]